MELSVQVQKQYGAFRLDLSFTMGPEILVIQGPSASGKTTLLKTINGLVEPDGGRISLGGRLLYDGARGVNIPIRDRRIGTVFQNYALFPHLTVEENLFFGLGRQDQPGRAWVWDQLAKFQLAGHLTHYPKQLSGGLQQRVALLRALAKRPDLLLLDEPFSALDQDLKEDLYGELIRVFESTKIPMILITHNQEEAQRLGHRILHLHGGRFQP